MFIVKRFVSSVVLSVCISSILGWMVYDYHTKLLKQQIFATYDHSEQVKSFKAAWQKVERIVLAEQIKRPKIGDAYATISSDRVGFMKDLFFGDGDAQLDAGIGQFPYSGLPGEGKPILVAGHNGTEFYKLREMQEGDIVKIETDYGAYEYQISHMEIMNAEDFDSNVLNEEKEYLIMYTCYPFHVIDTPQRYFVYADLVSGSKIKGDVL